MRLVRVRLGGDGLFHFGRLFCGDPKEAADARCGVARSKLLGRRICVHFLPNSVILKKCDALIKKCAAFVNYFHSLNV